jgi:hypothetical protein
MPQVLDLSVNFTPPPAGADPDVLAHISLHCDILGLSHSGDLLRDPLSPQEREDLQWYLEEYWKWPYEQFRERGKRIELCYQLLGRDSMRLSLVQYAPIISCIRGRARELLLLERALLQGQLVVVHGFGGTGKTALACEAADWFTRTHLYEGACFISFEQGGGALTVLSTLGRYLNIYDGDYNPAEIQAALARLQAVLRTTKILVIADNLESILAQGEAPLGPDERVQLWDTLLALRDMGAGVILSQSLSARLPRLFLTPSPCGTPGASPAPGYLRKWCQRTVSPADHPDPCEGLGHPAPCPRTGSSACSRIDPSSHFDSVPTFPFCAHSVSSSICRSTRRCSATPALHGWLH